MQIWNTFELLELLELEKYDRKDVPDDQFEGFEYLVVTIFLNSLYITLIHFHYRNKLTFSACQEKERKKKKKKSVGTKFRQLAPQEILKI